MRHLTDATKAELMLALAEAVALGAEARLALGAGLLGLKQARQELAKWPGRVVAAKLGLTHYRNGHLGHLRAAFMAGWWHEDCRGK